MNKFVTEYQIEDKDFAVMCAENSGVEIVFDGYKMIVTSTGEDEMYDFIHSWADGDRSIAEEMEYDVLWGVA